MLSEQLFTTSLTAAKAMPRSHLSADYADSAETFGSMTKKANRLVLSLLFTICVICETEAENLVFSATIFTQRRKPNVRHASACRQDWELSMCDVTGNHCLSDANLDDKLKHVGHLVCVFA